MSTLILLNCSQQGKRPAYAPILERAGHSGASSGFLANSENYSQFSHMGAVLLTVVAKKFPERIAEFMSYQSIIAKASQKYRWLSWVVYDQNFRKEAAGNPSQSWAKVDPSIYAQCFTGQGLSTESWCARCHSLDHTSASCPYCQRKRSWNTTMGSATTSMHGKMELNPPVCIKYNKFNGDCKFGKECHFLHVCSSCKESHPVSRCPKGMSGSSPAAPSQ